MKPEADAVRFALTQLDIIDRQAGRMLELARQPGLSDKDIRNLCRALFHLLHCRQTAMTVCEEWGHHSTTNQLQIVKTQT